MRSKFKKTGFLFRMMNKLSYTQKYLVAGLIRGIGFFILWIYLLATLNHQYDLVKTTLKDNRFHQPVQNAYQSILEYQLLPEKKGDEADNLKNKIDEELINLEILWNQRGGQILQDNSDVSMVSIKKKWESIKKAPPSILPKTRYIELLGQLEKVMEASSDKGVLEKDPIKSSQFLLSNSIQRIRDQQNMILTLLGGMSQAVDENRSLSIFFLEVEDVKGFLKRSFEEMSNELNKAFLVLDKIQDESELKNRMNIALYQYQIAIDEFISQLDAVDLEKSETMEKLDPTEVISNGFLIWNLSENQIGKLLAQDKDNLMTTLLYVFVISVTFTIVGCWLGVLFVYEAIKCFRNLDSGTRRFTSGELRARVPVLYYDEIGQATMTFNQMADHLEKLITQQRHLLKATEKLSSGDYSARVNVDEGMDEEINQVYLSFNAMAESFEEIINQLHRLGINLTSSATEIAGASKQQENLIVKQEEVTREISITASQISTTAKDFAMTIHDVGQVAEETSEHAASGQDSLINMEKIMRQMVDASGNISKKLAILNEKAGNITSVITTITKVADQTNLLSLNAAIEAEKTGEFGRRFSVIAREIRRLADQTALATLDIKGIVSEIMEAVTSSVTGVEDFTEKIHYGVEQVAKVGEQLGNIIIQVQALAFRFEAVNEGMQTQSGSAEKINEAMVLLSNAATSTTDSIHQFRTTIQQLIRVSDALRTTIVNINTTEEQKR